MPFYSVLFEGPEVRVSSKPPEEPTFFGDLNLDQIVQQFDNSVSVEPELTRLVEFLIASLHTRETQMRFSIWFRLSSLQNLHLFKIIRLVFAIGIGQAELY